MRLYTRRGDAGFTSLYGGMRVRKDDPRVASYGAVDELNAILGWAAEACRRPPVPLRLRAIQARLFEIGAELASPLAQGTRRRPVPGITRTSITRLERWIDEAVKALPPLRSFILPGGAEAACRLHLARTVCRRTERAVTRLVLDGAARGDILVYLNRLSDLLFAWARLTNYAEGRAESVWIGAAKRRRRIVRRR